MFRLRHGRRTQAGRARPTWWGLVWRFAGRIASKLAFLPAWSDMRDHLVKMRNNFIYCFRHAERKQYRPYAKVILACGSMVLFFICVLFFAPSGEKQHTEGIKCVVCV